MAEITFKGNTIHTSGEIVKSGNKAPDFQLVSQNLEDKTLKDFKDKRKLLLIVPSLDTDVCATCAKKLNHFAMDHADFAIVVVSADLPFAQKRFCTSENLNNLVTLSMMRSKDFATDYGVLIEDGPLKGLCARALLVVDKDNKVIYSELVPEITEEPNYDKAFEALEKSS